MAPDPDDIVGSVLEWLNAAARVCGVDSEAVMRFEHLCEDGQVIGAVFTTSDGLFPVRARHGVLALRDGVATAWLTADPAPRAAGLRHRQRPPTPWWEWRC